MINRIISRTSQFKKDYKREKKKDSQLDSLLMPVVFKLASDEVLEQKYCDHALIGDKKGLRDCHIKPNLALLCRIFDNKLVLVRLGSHAELNI